MYITITLIDGYHEVVEHNTSEEANAFAREVAEGGENCSVFMEMRHIPAQVRPLPQITNGVTPGNHFPGSLGGSGYWRDAV